MRLTVLALRRALLLSATLLTGVGFVRPVAAGPNDVFFSEYVEGSSNNKAFEIYNNTGSAIDLAAGMYVLEFDGFTNAGGATGSFTQLVGTIAAGSTAVFCNGSSNATILAVCPTANRSSNYSFTGDDTLILRRGGNAGAILDVIGQRDIDPGNEWGTGTASTQDNTIRRKSTICTGETNPDDSFDPTTQWDGFAIDTLDGLGAHTVSCSGSTDVAPTVQTISPTSNATNVAVNSNAVVTFSESVTTSASAFTLTCASSVQAFTFSGSGTTYTLDPNTDLPANTTCTVTISANGVMDQDGTAQPMAQDFTSSFTTAAAPVVGCNVTDTIMAIQGSRHLSTLDGSAVTTSGIITARRASGIFIQNPDGDANVNTSDGIFVFTDSAPASTLAVGDQVCVSGTVDEFRPGGESGFNLTVTEIVGPTITEATGLFANGVVATVLGTGGRAVPNAIIDNDSVDGADAGTRGDVETESTFDPSQDGIDFYESLEGMLVRVNNAVATGPTNQFGEIYVLGDNGANATNRNSRGGVTLVEQGGVVDYNAERIQLDDDLEGIGSNPDVSVGDGLGNVSGVIDYNFGNYELQVSALPVRTNNNMAREVTALVGTASKLTISNYNVENLDANDAQSRFDAIASQVVNNLKAPDILALQEVQDDNGATNNAVVTADATLNKLVQAITTAGGPTYKFLDVDPVDDQDGGEPGGNIRVAYLYNEARVTFVGGTPGGSTEATAPTLVGGKLTLTRNPGRIDPTNTAWDASRKPLAAAFEFNGQRFILINNHFKSKGGSEPLYGRYQPPFSDSEATRSAQAAIVNDFVDDTLAISSTARVAVMGDINEFSFNPPLKVLRGELPDNVVVLHDLVDEKITAPEERHGYVFEGNSETLDHLLVTDAFLSGAEVDIVNINSEYFDQISDHDPDLARLDMPAATCEAGTLNFKNAPYSVGEATATLTVTVQRTGGACGAASVAYATGSSGSGVQATAGSDYTATDGILNWADNDMADKSFTVTIANDALNEANEIIGLGLANATGAMLAGGGSTAATTATINDNDALPTVAFADTASRFAEDVATGVVSVTVSLNTASGRDVTVPFSISGTATKGAGSDYTQDTDSPLVILAGQTSRTVQFTLSNDSAQESDETIVLTIEDGVLNAQKGATTMHTLTITDNDAPPQDTQPDAFSFQVRNNIQPGALATSEMVTITGFTGMLTVTVSSGGLCSINQGPYVTSCNITPGQTLSVRHTAASGTGQTKDSTVTVGSTTALFRSITSNEDRVPDAFQFTTQEGVEPNTPIISNARTLTGFTHAAAIAAPQGFEYRINGGDWTMAKGSLLPSDTLQLRHTSNSKSLGYTRSTIRVGGAEGTFLTRTRKVQ